MRIGARCELRRFGSLDFASDDFGVVWSRAEKTGHLREAANGRTTVGSGKEARSGDPKKRTANECGQSRPIQSHKCCRSLECDRRTSCVVAALDLSRKIGRASCRERV